MLFAGIIKFWNFSQVTGKVSRLEPELEKEAELVTLKSQSNKVADHASTPACTPPFNIAKYTFQKMKMFSQKLLRSTKFNNFPTFRSLFVSTKKHSFHFKKNFKRNYVF